MCVFVVARLGFWLDIHTGAGCGEVSRNVVHCWFSSFAMDETMGAFVGVVCGVTWVAFFFYISVSFRIHTYLRFIRPSNGVGRQDGWGGGECSLALAHTIDTQPMQFIHMHILRIEGSVGVGS